MNKLKSTVNIRTELRKHIEKNDIDYVKDLIRSKQLSVNEVCVLVIRLSFHSDSAVYYVQTDSAKKTILMMAAENGLYELAAMCSSVSAVCVCILMVSISLCICSQSRCGHRSSG